MLCLDIYYNDRQVPHCQLFSRIILHNKFSIFFSFSFFEFPVFKDMYVLCINKDNIKLTKTKAVLRFKCELVDQIYKTRDLSKNKSDNNHL